ncbi:hypothetical protein ACFX16_007791 [Malus domestica]
MPSIPAAYEAHDLHISLNHRSGPRQVQEPKGHKPCGSPSTVFQYLNLRPQSRKLPLALAKPSSSSNGPCHNTSSAHAELTLGLCQPTCLTASTAAPQQHYPRKRQGKLIFSYLGAAQRRRRKQRKMVLCTSKM